MWTRIGVQTEVEALPWATYSARTARQEFNMRMGGWGSVDRRGLLHAGQHLRHLRPRAPTRRSNSGRFSNPALDTLTEQAASTLDDERREMMLREAVRMVHASTSRR